MGMELFGVALGSLGGGMGEASLLALAGKLDDDHGGLITAFSSGTGLAGVFGFAWHVFFVDLLQLSITQSLVIANLLAVTYGAIYTYCLDDFQVDSKYCTLLNTCDCDEDTESESESDFSAMEESINNNSSYQKQPISLSDWEVHQLSAGQRARLVLSLWPYMIPLFVVYASEYALQSGAWTAIGFPVDDIQARALFYEYSNWMYQIGVFLSRSSGTVYQASLPILWLMPAIQCTNLLFFCYTAITHTWYSWSLLSLCFLAGLLGGAVYVNAFTRINMDVPPHQREFALASASVADSLGILFANVLGLFIQSCLYQVNGIDGAIATCPL